ncbi:MULTISPECIES: sugar phosphate isomerase/epimerase family protein [unclassified Chelatococcus]|uniref:sugar phosphate isomerase/epimerase family protein n=1 Tax=unclassified Chelatococcus TaxID=2638111 RepID=UPI001BCB3315|nr:MULTISPECIES: sugar phosphate isomerase/epimerase family protein [unclassified Chelatococcus]CAH1657755.1 AP_endonuc_2 domain-containing protein [Hyphomicrobiales bacterium]MBS7742266.1 sugar phosphate isomerase/epimerase [Chelatococcus sp. HY11]MBX3542616.1 sugar phosphate isomerase/epimerase [Chelatococcus sp.]MCO5075167.1 sugar phosphate isomerase/epimerase [Chelatococcus sp.]CAH1689324.1 AP_endonuc_2 domain-containing protein [Hyphomicrobiales bacterium]
MIRYGFSTIGCPNYDVPQVVALARSHGFKGVEIRFLRGTVDLTSLAEFSPAGLADTRKRFQDAGIEVVGINTGVRMVSLDPAVRQQQRTTAKANLDIALGLGARYLRVFGGPIPAEQDRERSLDAIAEGLGEIADLTYAAGVHSLIETHDAFCRADSIRDLYKRGASRNLGVLWDTLHSYRHGETGEETWAKLNDQIKLVHVKDANTATPEKFDFALTGEGTVPVGSFLDLLERENFDGFVNFEWEKGWHPEIADPEIAIPHFAHFIASRGG